MQNNIFLNSGDPLLGTVTDYSGTSRSFEEEMARLDRAQQALVERRQEMAQTRSQMTQPQQSRTPVWDEIDKLVADMSDREIEYLNGSGEFQQSNQRVMAILQREQLRMMRPIVEGCKDGKEALESHLALVKKLRKEAANENDRTMDLFKEYTENYPDMPYAEFLKMKRVNKNNKK